MKRKVREKMETFFRIVFYFIGRRSLVEIIFSYETQTCFKK